MYIPKRPTENLDPFPIPWKKRNYLINSRLNRTTTISGLPNDCAKFITRQDTTNINVFLTLKLRSNSQRTTKLICLFALDMPVGKTDRYLITRIKEHTRESENHNHIHSCVHFQYILNLLNLPSTLLNLNKPTI